MIRPLRQAHRAFWPLAAIAIAWIGYTASLSAERAAFEPAAPVQGTAVDIGDARLAFELQGPPGQRLLFLRVADTERATTGAMDVFVVSDGWTRVGSLQSAQRGLAVDDRWLADSGHLSVRLYDVIRQRWGSDAFTVEPAP